jgi:biopolymer transport protein ExbD
MAFGTGHRGGFKAEINVTPLVDVVLVLLIIFMIVTPLLGHGRDLDLPRVHSAVGQQAASAAGLVLSLTPEGQLWLDAREVSETELAELVAARKAHDRYLHVMIRADASVSVRTLRPVLRTLRRGGVSQISFAALSAEGRP